MIFGRGTFIILLYIFYLSYHMGYEKMNFDQWRLNLSWIIVWLLTLKQSLLNPLCPHKYLDSEISLKGAPFDSEFSTWNVWAERNRKSTGDYFNDKNATKFKTKLTFTTWQLVKGARISGRFNRQDDIIITKMPKELNSKSDNCIQL